MSNFDHRNYLMPEPAPAKMAKSVDPFAEERRRFALRAEERRVTLEAFERDDAKRDALPRAKYDKASLGGVTFSEASVALLREQKAHEGARPRIGKDEEIEAFAERRAAWYARSEELDRQVSRSCARDLKAHVAAQNAAARARAAKLDEVAAPHREAYADAARKFVAALADAEAHLGEMTSAFNIVVGHAQTTDGRVPVPQLPPPAAVAALDRLKRMAKSAPTITGVMPLGGEAYGQLRLDRRNIDLTAREEGE